MPSQCFLIGFLFGNSIITFRKFTRMIGTEFSKTPMMYAFQINIVSLLDDEDLVKMTFLQRGYAFH